MHGPTWAHNCSMTLQSVSLSDQGKEAKAVRLRAKLRQKVQGALLQQHSSVVDAPQIEHVRAGSSFDMI